MSSQYTKPLHLRLKILARFATALWRFISPHDIVVLDNLSSHKAKGVRETIEARGAVLR